MAMWYYTRDRKSRVGPVSDEQLRELIAGRQVEPADMVWREGFQTWLPVAQVADLAAVVPAPPKPQPIPVAVVPPAPAPAASRPIPVQVVSPSGPLRAEVLPEEPPAAPKPAAPIPVAVMPVPVSVAPAPVALAPNQEPAGGLSALGGFFKKAAAAVAPPRPQSPAPTSSQLALVQPIAVELVKDGVSARDTGDFEPEQFTRCRESLREAGVAPEELVFFCSTRNRQQAGGSGIFNLVGGPQPPRPVLHLALTRREVALVYEGEGKKIVVDRAPHEAISWKFADAEEAGKPAALGMAALFKRDQAAPERVEVLQLGLPSGDHELRLSPGEGLTTLKQRAAQVFQERARAHMADGKCFYADKLLGQIEPGLLGAGEVEALRQQIGAVAEAVAQYQGGHPHFLDGERGVLRLDALGLEFVPGEPAHYLRIPYDHILDVLEPQRGEFPDELVKSSELKKSAGRTVGLLTGFAGAAMKATNTTGAGLVSGVGKTVAGDLKDRAALGAPPKNRVCAVLLLGGVKHRVSFDVVAATKEEMEQQAKTFWNRTAAVRARFARPGPPAAKVAAAPTTGGAMGHLAALRELKELLDQGVLTQEEFAQQKAVLLGQTRGIRAATAVDVQPRVVGCPRCQSKLRAKKPGVIQCPKCQAKVRVADSLFQ